MTGIKIPDDRCCNVPARGYCRNPDCQDTPGQEFTFEVVDDMFCCPKCGSHKLPMTGLLVLTHLVIQDENGPVTGSSGKKYYIGCDPTRTHFATASNLEAVTTDPEVANCPGCLAEAERIGFKKKWAFKPQ